MNWSRCQSCLLLSFIIPMMLTHCPARAQATDGATKDDIPKLLALTWQKGSSSNSEFSDIPWWLPDGKIVPEEMRRELQAELKGTEIVWRRDYSVPLILIFEYQNQLTPGTRGTAARLVFDDNHRSSGGNLGNRYQGRKSTSRMFSVSSIHQFIPDVRFDWPKTVDLTLSFPIEETQIVKTLMKYPQGRVEFGKGVSWAAEPEGGHEPGGDGERFPAGVLRLSEDAIELLEFSVGVFRKGSDTKLKEAFVTNQDIDGEVHEIRVSQRLPEQSELDRIEFYRRRFRRTVLKDIAIRTDLLPGRQPR